MLHPTPYTINPELYTLHPTPYTYTLHPTPYTLHLTAYTLHPTPYTRCENGSGCVVVEGLENLSVLGLGSSGWWQ